MTGGPLVTPEGKGRILAGDRKISFFLEYDRGTEHLEQLELKIERYRLVWGSPRQPDALLFVFPSAARERAVRRFLLGPGFTLATAVRAPAFAIRWGQSGCRCATIAATPSSTCPGAP